MLLGTSLISDLQLAINMVLLLLLLMSTYVLPFLSFLLKRYMSERRHVAPTPPTARYKASQMRLVPLRSDVIIPNRNSNEYC